MEKVKLTNLQFFLQNFNLLDEDFLEIDSVNI